MEKELSEQEETDERQEKINGSPSEFLYYVLGSVKLGEKDNKEKKFEATLQNLDNEMIIHWKEGFQQFTILKNRAIFLVQTLVL